MRHYIDTLYDPGELLALVGLNGGKQLGRTAAGYYRDWEAFFRDAQRYSGRVNLYINLNRLHPDLYGRAADRFKPYATTTFTASEVIWRPRICVDLDPVRISGINSTDAELAAAIDLSRTIRDYIESEWSVNVVPVCSGNGVQLVFRIDEAPESSLVADFLKHIDQKFSTDRVKIDATLADLPQLVRLPGTLNMKGDNIPERPQRMAYIMEEQK
jgi:hypothetical protein